MRKILHTFVLLIFTLLLLGTEICHSKELNDISTDKNLKEWYGYFFKPDSIIDSYNEKELVNYYWQKVNDLSEFTFYDYEYKCNSSKTFCISIDYNFEIVKRNGKKKIEPLGPDSFVHLVDTKNKTVSQIFSIGSAGTILGSFWSSEKSIVIYGLEMDDGFIIKIDLATHQKTIFNIKKAYRRPNTSKNEFIMKAQWSSADR